MLLPPPLSVCAIAAPASSWLEPCSDDAAVPGAHTLRSDQHFWDMHEDLQPLGKGFYGCVRLATVRSTGTLAAVKVVDKTNGRTSETDPRQEPLLLQSLRHPNIVRLLVTYESPCSLFIVMSAELGGDLLARARSFPGGRFPEAEACRHTRGLLRAVEHIHARGVVHRDIKPSNVLLSADGEVRLADFGLSQLLPPSGVLTTVCGTHDFLAPEMILCGHGEVDGYGIEVDMWAVGLLIFFLLHGRNPFELDTEIETLQAILSAQYDIPQTDGVGSVANDLICRLLVCDPTQRCRASEAVRHDWITVSGSALRRSLCAAADSHALSRARAVSDSNRSLCRLSCAMDHAVFIRGETRALSFDLLAALAAR
uniref:Protein kinase domain-containing protein n=1 Tax=Coccolithus braarudii TaxID=221442 RepID=A0A7S0QA52_9EUKA|mmetsp:Transcript_51923/g.110974  ORF Transcript_51923/g.110974 Transcript_51923/m.110974 type:complete len:368 (+) Transcript_51923:132-1235(+)